jgi:hypothetical protein
MLEMSTVDLSNVTILKWAELQLINTLEGTICPYAGVDQFTLFGVCLHFLDLDGTTYP